MMSLSVAAVFFLLLRQTLLTHSESSSAFSSFIVEHEEQKPCAYQDDTGETLVGFKLLLKSKETREFFKIIGADYDKFYNSELTLKKDVCLCSRVPCLSKEQIAILLDMKIEEVLNRTTSLIPSFESLCFGLQSVFVDIAYSSTRNGFIDIVKLIADKLYQDNWLAIANILKATQWCRQHEKRCSRNRNLVLKGCEEDDRKRNRRYVREHRDLEFSVSFSVCCKETLTMKNEEKILESPSILVTDRPMQAIFTKSSVIANPNYESVTASKQVESTTATKKIDFSVSEAISRSVMEASEDIYHETITISIASATSRPIFPVESFASFGSSIMVSTRSRPSRMFYQNTLSSQKTPLLQEIPFSTDTQRANEVSTSHIIETFTTKDYPVSSVPLKIFSFTKYNSFKIPPNEKLQTNPYSISRFTTLINPSLTISPSKYVTKSLKVPKKSQIAFTNTTTAVTNKMYFSQSQVSGSLPLTTEYLHESGILSSRIIQPLSTSSPLHQTQIRLSTSDFPTSNELVKVSELPVTKSSVAQHLQLSSPSVSKLKPTSSVKYQVQPFQTSVPEGRPTSSVFHKTQPLQPSVSELEPLSSALHQEKSLHPSHSELESTSSVLHQVQPLQPSHYELKSTSSALHQVQPLHPSHSKLESTSSVLHQVQPLQPSISELETMSSVLHQVQPLHQSASEPESTSSVLHQVQPLHQSASEPESTSSVLHQVQPLHQPASEPESTSSVLHQVQPLHQSASELETMSPVLHQVQPLHQSASEPESTSSVLHQVQPLHQSASEPESTSSVLHQVQPLEPSISELESTSSVLHQLQPLNPSHSEPEPTLSVLHQIQPLQPSISELESTSSVLYQEQPLQTSVSELESTSSVLHQVQPLHPSHSKPESTSSVLHHIQPLQPSISELESTSSVLYQAQPLQTSVSELESTLLHQVQPLHQTASETKVEQTSVLYQLHPLNPSTSKVESTSFAVLHQVQPSHPSLSELHPKSSSISHQTFVSSIYNWQPISSEQKQLLPSVVNQASNISTKQSKNVSVLEQTLTTLSLNPSKPNLPTLGHSELTLHRSLPHSQLHVLSISSGLPELVDTRQPLLSIKSSIQHESPLISSTVSYSRPETSGIMVVLPPKHRSTIFSSFYQTPTLIQLYQTATESSLQHPLITKSTLNRNISTSYEDHLHILTSYELKQPPVTLLTQTKSQGTQTVRWPLSRPSQLTILSRYQPLSTLVYLNKSQETATLRQPNQLSTLVPANNTQLTASELQPKPTLLTLNKSEKTTTLRQPSQYWNLVSLNQSQKETTTVNQPQSTQLFTTLKKSQDAFPLWQTSNRSLNQSQKTTFMANQPQTTILTSSVFNRSYVASYTQLESSTNLNQSLVQPFKATPIKFTSTLTVSVILGTSTFYPSITKASATEQPMSSSKVYLGSEVSFSPIRLFLSPSLNQSVLTTLSSQMKPISSSSIRLLTSSSLNQPLITSFSSQMTPISSSPIRLLLPSSLNQQVNTSLSSQMTPISSSSIRLLLPSSLNQQVNTSLSSQMTPISSSPLRLLLPSSLNQQVNTSLSSQMTPISTSPIRLFLSSSLNQQVNTSLSSQMTPISSSSIRLFLSSSLNQPVITSLSSQMTPISTSAIRLFLSSTPNQPVISSLSSRTTTVSSSIHLSPSLSHDLLSFSLTSFAVKKPLEKSPSVSGDNMSSPGSFVVSATISIATYSVSSASPLLPSKTLTETVTEDYISKTATLRTTTQKISSALSTNTTSITQSKTSIVITRKDTNSSFPSSVSNIYSTASVIISSTAVLEENYDVTYMVKFSGDCSNLITSIASFKISFIQQISVLLHMNQSDIEYHSAICGSVLVTFTIRHARLRNTTRALKLLIDRKFFNISFKGNTYRAVGLTTLSSSTQPPEMTVTTPTSDTDKKRITLIAFAIGGAFFFALFIIGCVIICARTCARRGSRAQFNVHGNSSRSNEFEMKRFAPAVNGTKYYNKVDFYGDSTEEREQMKTKDSDTDGEEDEDEHEFENNAALLRNNPSYRRVLPTADNKFPPRMYFV